MSRCDSNHLMHHITAPLKLWDWQCHCCDVINVTFVWDWTKNSTQYYTENPINHFKEIFFSFPLANVVFKCGLNTPCGAVLSVLSALLTNKNFTHLCLRLQDALLLWSKLCILIDISKSRNAAFVFKCEATIWDYDCICCKILKVLDFISTCTVASDYTRYLYILNTSNSDPISQLNCFSFLVSVCSVCHPN